MIAIAAGAAVGAIEGLRQGLVRYRAGVLMSAMAVVFTGAGAWLAHRIPTGLLAGLFGAVMLIVAWRAWHGDAKSQSTHSALCRADPVTGRLIWTPQTMVLIGLVGALTGTMTGLLGVGGGFVIVPALRRSTDLTLHGIVATSLLVIALTSSCAVLAALWHGAVLPAPVTWTFLAAVVAGMVAGRLLSRRLPAHRVQRGFALLVFVIALDMISRAF